MNTKECKLDKNYEEVIHQIVDDRSIIYFDCPYDLYFLTHLLLNVQ